MRYSLACGTALVLVFAALAGAATFNFRPEEISNQLTVGYAVRLVDMNEDGKPDIVVVDTERVVWFQNPDWQMHTLIQDQTKPHNVCLAPYDIDGDGKIDFALGADWRPFDTRSGGTIQWIGRGKSAAEKWDVHPIGTEPTIHRMQWADLDGDGRAELIVVPLMGRDTTQPNFSEKPLRILAYKIPADPVAGPWEPEVLNEELHVAHNLCPTDLDHDGKADILVASFEGVSWLHRGGDGKWARALLGEGNQQTSPNRGASEVKHGRLGSGRDYIATIEPWHGFQVVVYTPPVPGPDGKTPALGERLWTRRLLDDQLQWGHAVWCADLDGDADQELIIGVRDTKDADNPCGLRIYDPTGDGDKWERHLVDPGGVAIEDLAVEDLNGDGKLDIVAVGRQTKNVRIYWNESK